MENEKRLIDANALQLDPDPWGGMNGVICVGRSGGKTMATVQAALRRMIDNAPTVDAVEVVHGRWIERPLDNFRKYEVKCSECGFVGIGNYDQYLEPYDFNYCPNCGAKMDGGGDNG